MDEKLIQLWQDYEMKRGENAELRARLVDMLTIECKRLHGDNADLSNRIEQINGAIPPQLRAQQEELKRLQDDLGRQAPGGWAVGTTPHYGMFPSGDSPTR